MKHPIYDNPSIVKTRNVFITSVEKIGYEKTVDLFIENIFVLNNGSYTRDQLKLYSEAQMNGFMIDNEISKNGHVLISIKRDEWESKQSENTISMIDINNLKFPFVAGTIKVDDDIFSFNVNTEGIDTRLMLTREEDSGLHLVKLVGGISVRDAIEDVIDNEDNSKMIYVILSSLMYIASFKNTKRVESKIHPRFSGSKRKEIPKHSVNTIKLSPSKSIHNSGNISKSEKQKSDKYWIVRGFWRNQYYSKEGINKPKWIDPYFKGSGKEEVEKIYKV